MNPKITHILSSLGLDLNPKEIKIYLSLLEVGTAAASTLGQRTHINRSTAQYTCQQLVETGLARVIEKNNTFLYSAEPPERLISLLDGQKEKITQKQIQVEQILGDLKGLMNPYANTPKVQFFTGVEGIISMYEDILSEAKPLLGAVHRSKENNHPKIRAYLEKHYVPQRTCLKNPAWIIFNDTSDAKSYQEKDKEMKRISLILSEKDFPFQSSCHIYGDKVAFFRYKNDDLSGVIIQNPFVHATQKAFFQFAWDTARKQPQNKKYKDICLPD